MALHMQSRAAASMPHSVCETLMDTHRSKAQCACRSDIYGLGGSLVHSCHKTIVFTFFLVFWHLMVTTEINISLSLTGT